MKDFDESKDEYTGKLNIYRNELKDLQDKYQQAKNSIELARTDEEREFWQRRADGYLEGKDKKEFEFEKLIQKNKNNMSEFNESSDEGMDVILETSENVEDTNDVDNLPEGNDEVPLEDEITEENSTDTSENDTDIPVDEENEDVPPEDDTTEENGTDASENDTDIPVDEETASKESEDVPPEDEIAEENDMDIPVDEETVSKENEDVPPEDDTIEENDTDTQDTVQTDVEDESQLSVSELRARSEAEAAQRQAEFDTWAEEHDVNTFSDGTPIQGHENDMYTRTPTDVETMERDGIIEKMRYDDMKKAQAAKVSEDESDTEEDTDNNTENKDTGTESINEDMK